MDPLEVFYLDHLRSICARAETPTSLVEGKSLDEHAHFVRHRLSEKGKLLWYQINSLLCYAWNLCEIYDFTCCSKNPKKHLPYLCEFSDNEILSSYGKGVYSYYDIEQIEEFVIFKGAHEVASLIEKYDITLYKSENFDILKYCYENYADNVYVQEFIERMTVALEENNDMHESIDNYDSDDLIEISLDEHDACYSYGHDANIYGDEFAIVPYVKNESIAIAPILDSSLNQKHDCNDVIINSINVNCVDDMQNPKLGDASFAMSTSCCNDHDWGDFSYDLENLFKPYDEYVCNNIESGFGRVSTLGYNDPTTLEYDQSYEIFDKSGFGEVMTLFDDNPTILEECQLCMHVDHVENILCDSYIVEFEYDPTYNYYEREKYGCGNLHVSINNILCLAKGVKR